MIKTYIPLSLIRELQEAFPNHLPSEGEYNLDHITPEQIAFRAGRQDLIDYLAASSKVQQESDLNDPYIEIH